jgi:hypothetical protein
VLRALIHRGGLRADILSDGQIEVGSAIEPVVQDIGQKPSG